MKYGSRRFEIALLIGLMLIGPIMAFSYYSLRHLDEARKVQEHSLVVQDHLDDLRSAVHDFEVRYLRAAPEEEKGESRAKIDAILDDLSQSVEEDEIQTESLVEVRASISEFVADPTAERAKDVQEWIDSMDAQEVEYLGEHRPAAITFLSTASGSILIVGILSLFLSFLALIGLRRQMRSREIIEDELRAAEKQATLASDMKSKFLATISHEIRTPLNGIIAMSDVMRRSELSEKDQRLANVIFQSSQALLRIINDLLDFSQIESGQVGLEAEIFSVRTVVENTCSVLDLKAQNKGIKIISEVDPAVPPLLLGDGGRLGQVLFNLIGNAIKFTEKGRIDVKVELDPASDEKVSRVNFSVRDTGHGVAEDDMASLFQPFNRLGKVGTSGEPGTGLGLSISQSLVRQMGGEIRAESRINDGAVFWFQLPMKNTPQENMIDRGGESTSGESSEISRARAIEEKVGAAISPPFASHFKGVRVLVAEDNETNQVVAETILEQLGCEVSLVGTGQEAIDRIFAGDYDLVLMDCQMPVLDGYEATRRIRSMESDVGRRPIRIVAMTANAQADDRARCLASGMDDYISKPFVTDDLIKVLSGGDSLTDRLSIELAIANLTKRLGRDAVRRLREAFFRSLAEWPLDSSSEKLEKVRLTDLAHKLKSSARAVGAEDFASRLERLEFMLANSNEDAITADAVSLKNETDRDVRNLKRLFAA